VRQSGAVQKSDLVKTTGRVGEFLGTTTKFRYWFPIITRLPMI
jgi:hypothetical protein